MPGYPSPLRDRSAAVHDPRRSSSTPQRTAQQVQMKEASLLRQQQQQQQKNLLQMHDQLLKLQQLQAELQCADSSPIEDTPAVDAVGDSAWVTPLMATRALASSNLVMTDPSAYHEQRGGEGLALQQGLLRSQSAANTPRSSSPAQVHSSDESISLTAPSTPQIQARLLQTQHRPVVMGRPLVAQKKSPTPAGSVTAVSTVLSMSASASALTFSSRERDWKRQLDSQSKGVGADTSNVHQAGDVSNVSVLERSSFSKAHLSLLTLATDHRYFSAVWRTQVDVQRQGMVPVRAMETFLCRFVIPELPTLPAAFKRAHRELVRKKKIAPSSSPSRSSVFPSGGDTEWVQRSDARRLFIYILFFLRLSDLFPPSKSAPSPLVLSSASSPEWLSFVHFFSGISRLGLAMDKRHAMQAFRSLDTREAGAVAFDQFCDFVAPLCLEAFEASLMRQAGLDLGSGKGAGAGVMARWEPEAQAPSFGRTVDSTRHKENKPPQRLLSPPRDTVSSSASPAVFIEGKQGNAISVPKHSPPRTSSVAEAAGVGGDSPTCVSVSLVKGPGPSAPSLAALQRPLQPFINLQDLACGRASIAGTAAHSSAISVDGPRSLPVHAHPPADLHLHEHHQDSHQPHHPHMHNGHVQGQAGGPLSDGQGGHARMVDLARRLDEEVQEGERMRAAIDILHKYIRAKSGGSNEGLELIRARAELEEAGRFLAVLQSSHAEEMRALQTRLQTAEDRAALLMGDLSAATEEGAALAERNASLEREMNAAATHRLEQDVLLQKALAQVQANESKVAQIDTTQEAVEQLKRDLAAARTALQGSELKASKATQGLKEVHEHWKVEYARLSEQLDAAEDAIQQREEVARLEATEVAVKLTKEKVQRDLAPQTHRQVERVRSELTAQHKQRLRLAQQDVHREREARLVAEKAHKAQMDALLDRVDVEIAQWRGAVASKQVLVTETQLQLAELNGRFQARVGAEEELRVAVQQLRNRMKQQQQQEEQKQDQQQEQQTGGRAGVDGDDGDARLAHENCLSISRRSVAYVQGLEEDLAILRRLLSCAQEEAAGYKALFQRVTATAAQKGQATEKRARSFGLHSEEKESVTDSPHRGNIDVGECGEQAAPRGGFSVARGGESHHTRGTGAIGRVWMPTEKAQAGGEDENESQDKDEDKDDIKDKRTTEEKNEDEVENDDVNFLYSLDPSLAQGGPVPYTRFRGSEPHGQMHPPVDSESHAQHQDYHQHHQPNMHMHVHVSRPPAPDGAKCAGKLTTSSPPSFFTPYATPARADLLRRPSVVDADHAEAAYRLEAGPGATEETVWGKHDEEDKMKKPLVSCKAAALNPFQDDIPPSAHAFFSASAHARAVELVERLQRMQQQQQQLQQAEEGPEMGQGQVRMRPTLMAASVESEAETEAQDCSIAGDPSCTALPLYFRSPTKNVLPPSPFPLVDQPEAVPAHVLVHPGRQRRSRYRGQTANEDDDEDADADNNNNSEVDGEADEESHEDEDEDEDEEGKATEAGEKGEEPHGEEAAAVRLEQEMVEDIFDFTQGSFCSPIKGSPGPGGGLDDSGDVE